MLDALQSLARICTRPNPAVGDVAEACALVRDALGAADAYVIRAGDPDFIRMGCDCEPSAYEIKQKGYWIVWRQLAANPQATAGAFDVQDRLVSGGSPIDSGSAATHVVAILPGDESNSDLLVLHGPWPQGLAPSHVQFIEAALPAIGHLISNVLDAERRARQRTQLESLANVSDVFNKAQEAEDVLTALATALAKASGFEWVTIVQYNDACDDVADRVMNLARHSDTQIAAQFQGRGSASDVDVQFGLQMARTGSPILLPDVFEQGLADRGDVALLRSGLPSLQRYWQRAHILSVAMFPIVFQQKPLGYVTFNSSTSHVLDTAEVDFLSAAVSQAATVMHGLRLYCDLQDSREEVRRSEERFRSLVQNATDLVTIVDEGGTLLYASPSVQRLLGYDPEHWLGHDILLFVHPEDVTETAAIAAEVRSAPGVRATWIVRVRHADASYRYFETTATNLLHVPSVQGVVHNAHDITERWQAEAAVRQSEERFRSLVQNASDLITVIEADTTIKYQSPSVAQVLGYRPEDILGTRLSDLIHADDVARTLAVLHDAVGNPAARATAEMRVRHRDGSWRNVEFIGTDQRDNLAIGGFVLNIRDVSERNALEQQLRYQALHDPLTRLGNRTRFADRLEHALLRSARTGHQISVLFLDLDNFKAVNDSLGHSAGDCLLTQVAERVQGCLRPGDTLARLGGDEFAVLLEDVASREDATMVTDRIFAAMDAPFELEGKEIVVRCSVGIALSGDGMGADADSLLRNADVAMYVAKSRGKACYEVFDETMQHSMMERLELLADLQRAVERDEFILHYQPMVELQTGRLYGVEALVRWQHPRRGLIQPNDFIGLAEESGAIMGLGRCVMERACRQAVVWENAFPAASDWTLSVNVSARQLQHPGFVAEVAQILRDTGLSPRRLILEITESVMMHDVKLMMGRLQDLKALGVRLAIDDFGTGYSSLSYLRQFPFDLLKIDKSFIDDVGSVTRQKEMTRAIIELGKTLDLELVAEGIERNEQLSRLKTMDCEVGQGFYFARPLDSEDVEALLSQLVAGRETDRDAA
jgi:diguanylate cyclase (GGDEF)-like protein/PAS domain S-box-containing protein